VTQRPTLKKPTQPKPIGSIEIRQMAGLTVLCYVAALAAWGYFLSTRWPLVMSGAMPPPTGLMEKAAQSPAFLIFVSACFLILPIYLGVMIWLERKKTQRQT
jgi:hypothetical protein